MPRSSSAPGAAPTPPAAGTAARPRSAGSLQVLGDVVADAGPVADRRRRGPRLTRAYAAATSGASRVHQAQPAGQQLRTDGGELAVPDVERASSSSARPGSPRPARPRRAACFSSAFRCRSTRSWSARTPASRGARSTSRSSRKRRRPSGSPFTRARSSGANSTVRSWPSTSRGRGSGERFSRARFARPGTISSSTRRATLRRARSAPGPPRGSRRRGPAARRSRPGGWPGSRRTRRPRPGSSCPPVRPDQGRHPGLQRQLELRRRSGSRSATGG